MIEAQDISALEADELYLICDSIGDAVMLLSSSEEEDGFHIVYANAACTQIYGYTQREILGQQIGFLGNHIAPEVLANLRQKLAAGIPFRGQYELTAKDGSSVWVQANLRPLPADAKGRKRWLAVHSPLSRERQLQGDLKEAFNQLHFITRNAPVALMVIDEDSNIRYAGGAVLKQIGCDSESLLGQPIQKACAEYPDFLRDLKLARAGKLETATHRIQNCYLEARFSPLTNQTRGHIGTTWVWTDISAHVASYELAQKMESLLSTTPDIVIFDDGTQVTYLNQSGQKLLPWVKNPSGAPIESLAQDFSVLESPRAQALKEGLWSGELSFGGPAENPLICSVVIVAKRDESGKLLFVATIARDIREAKAVEQSLREAKQQAELADQAKSCFLANMSHEIRTPLNAILGFTRILQSEDDLSETLKQRLRSIHKNGEMLLSLLADVLDLSKVENGSLQLVPQSLTLGDLFEELTHVFELSAKEKSLSFHVTVSPSVPSEVLVDPTRIRQILFNLLGNAFKYTESGQVELCVDAKVSESNADLCFSIRDTGCGISKEDQKHIFDSFVQRGPDKGGVGLGLAITSLLVRAMGGGVDLHSEPGKGSEFTVTLPNIRVLCGKTISLSVNPTASDPVAQAPVLPYETRKALLGDLKSLLPQHASIMDTGLKLGQIRTFATSLQSIESANDYPPLADFLLGLQAAVLQFDFDAIAKRMRSFPDIVSQLQESLKAS